MKFEVYNQNLYARFIPLIVAGTTGYLEADFSFTEDWDGLTKTAYFYDGTDIKEIVLVSDKISTDMTFTLTAGDWILYLVGDESGTIRITTDSVSFTVMGENPSTGTPFESLPISWQEWILEELSNIGSGGFSNNVYLTNMASEVSGYLKSSTNPDTTTTEKAITCNNNIVLGQTYLFDNQVGITTIDAGFWNFIFNTKVSATAGVTQIKVEQIKRHLNGTEEVMFEAFSGEINNTDIDRITFQIWQPQLEVLATDRMGIRIYAKTTSSSNRTITYLLGDGQPSYLTTPLAMRHSQLRDINGQFQYQHFNGVDTATGKKYILTITNGVVTPVEVT